MKKTKLDLFLSAAKAAVDSLGQTNSLDVVQFSVARFESETLDKRDWDYWSQNFNQHRQTFAQLKTQQSNSPLTATTTT